MTPDEIAIVRKSYEKLDEHRELFAQAFYEQLFVANPNISLMFDGNLDEQIERFRVMLFTVVYGLDDAEEVRLALRRLGQRHVHYGVQPSDYIGFGAALFWTLQHFLGADFDGEVRRAWKAFYAFISDAMLEGAAAGATGATQEVEAK